MGDNTTIQPALDILDRVVERLGNIKNDLVEVENEINQIRKQRHLWRKEQKDKADQEKADNQ